MHITESLTAEQQTIASVFSIKQLKSFCNVICAIWFGNTVFPSILIDFRNSLVMFLNNIFEAFLVFYKSIGFMTTKSKVIQN